KITLNTTHEVVHGVFHVQRGSVEFERANTKMTGQVVVAASSGTTGNGSRDKRMNKEILKVEHYLTMSFVPIEYAGTIAQPGDSTIQVTGVFTLLDVPHPITVPMSLHIDGSNVVAKTHFSIPYVQWGLKDPSLLFWRVDKDVSVDLTLMGQLSN
ncbi:MAG: YceI family protein, partial [Terriglobus sp.]